MPNHKSLDALRGWSYWRESARLTRASWREMFERRSIVSNLAAGLTIAVVALPLNLALAIFCGLPPSVGLLTGAVAGALCAFLGGARLQVSGPEVALAPITLLIVQEHGFEGLLVATFLAGIFQIGFGLLRLGRYVALLPASVTMGFLVAVGLLVFDSQLPRLLGLPAEVSSLREATLSALVQGVSLPAALIGIVTLAVIVLAPRVLPRIPGPLSGLIVGVSLALFIPGLPTVEAFELRFPNPKLPDFGALELSALIPEALALAMIASIDSLLCALSIDARIGERTRGDQELVAQGVANIACASIGAMPVAAAVVRSMAAVEAGATTRLAPLAQAFWLGLVLLVLGQVVTYVPLVALASVLLVVGYRLLDLRSLRALWAKAERAELSVVAVTAAGILVFDFVIGVGIGIAAALVQFARRQGRLFDIQRSEATGSESVRRLRLKGPLFFGAQSRLDSLVDSVEPGGSVVVDLSELTTVDNSGAASLKLALERLASKVDEVWLHGAPLEHGHSFTAELLERIQSERVSLLLTTGRETAALRAPEEPRSPPAPPLVPHDPTASQRHAPRSLLPVTALSSSTDP